MLQTVRTLVGGSSSRKRTHSDVQRVGPHGGSVGTRRNRVYWTPVRVVRRSGRKWANGGREEKLTGADGAVCYGAGFITVVLLSSNDCVAWYRYVRYVNKQAEPFIFGILNDNPRLVGTFISLATFQPSQPILTLSPPFFRRSSLNGSGQRQENLLQCASLLLPSLCVHPLTFFLPQFVPVTLVSISARTTSVRHLTTFYRRADVRCHRAQVPKRQSHDRRPQPDSD